VTSELKIPNRFESLEETFGQGLRPLVVPIDSDLKTLVSLRDRARVQSAGLLCFLLGPSGIGKTTAVHSAAVHMPEAFAPVLSVLPTVPIRDAADWVNRHIPPRNGDKALLVLFDGREVSDDSIGLRQLLSTLNQLVRTRPDVLLCWPTTDPEWHNELRGIAEKVGGDGFAPKESDMQVAGPPAGEWPTVLERLLLQFSKTYADVGLGSDIIGGFCASERTIGAFLGRVGQVIAARVTETRTARQLPQLVFVVTSSGDVVGEANRIRRAGMQSLAAEPLLGHSPRSEVGKWWTERNRDANYHLGYMTSLFDARLVTMTASAVVYACLHAGDTSLEAPATNAGARADKGNAKRTIESSELFKFLNGEQIGEFTSSKKGALQQSTIHAYAAIQALSNTRHKVINMALCKLVRDHLARLEYSDGDFEVSHGGNVITDAIVRLNSKTFFIEFHHLSQGQCVAASMASYIMGKLRTYAWHHQLIPR